MSSSSVWVISRYYALHLNLWRGWDVESGTKNKIGTNAGSQSSQRKPRRRVSPQRTRRQTGKRVGLFGTGGGEVFELEDFAFGERAEFARGNVEDDGAELNAFDFFYVEADM